MLFTLYTLHNSEAHAASGPKPSVITESSGDITEADTAINKVIKAALYIAYAAGAISLAIGLILSAPAVGKPDQGMRALKGGAYVLLGAGAFHIIVGFFGGLF